MRIHNESRSGTNVPQVVCRAQFENRISAAAAGEYLSGLFSACDVEAVGVTQDCMFSNAGAGVISRAQGVEGQLPGKREQMTDESFRLARENDEFAQAIPIGTKQISSTKRRASAARTGAREPLSGFLLEAVVDGDVLGLELHAGRGRGLLDQDREVAVGVARLHELVDLDTCGLRDGQ